MNLKESVLLASCILLLGTTTAFAQSSSHISDIGPSSAMISWNGCADDDNKISFRIKGTEEWIDKYCGTLSSVKLSGLRPKNHYEFRVKTGAKNGIDEWSPVEEFLTIGRPNILLIVADDGRFDSYTVNGGPEFFQSPNINRIAEEGVNFKFAFPATSLCSPSRACIVTGLYPHHSGVVQNGFIDSLIIPTVATILHDSGYYTGFVGKYGFEKFPIPGYDYWVESSSNDYFNSKYDVNGDIKYIAGHKTDVLTDKAIEFIDQVPADQPFCLLLEHKAPHVPYDPRDEDDELYETETMPMPVNFNKYSENYPDYYYECHNFDGNIDSVESYYLGYFQLLAGLEYSVGTVLDKLEDKGILDSTIVIFTSDNGVLKGEHYLMGKQVAQEESIRIPMFIRYPKWFAPNTVIDDEMVVNIDIAPTMLDAAGISSPVQMDGWSMRDIVTGAKSRKQFMYVFYNKEECTPTIHSVRTFDHKYIFNSCDNVTEEFYDLVNDSLENTNVINFYSYQPLIQQYRDKLDSLKNLYGDTVWVDTIIPCHLEDITTQIGDVADEDEINISAYPNPVQSTLHIKWSVETGEEAEIKVNDILGREILHLNFDAKSKQHEDTWNTAEWPQGIYLIVFKSGNEQRILKILKE